MKTTGEWAIREILIAHRLPYFHWQVWAIILIFSDTDEYLVEDGAKSYTVKIEKEKKEDEDEIPF